MFISVPLIILAFTTIRLSVSCNKLSQWPVRFQVNKTTQPTRLTTVRRR